MLGVCKPQAPYGEPTVITFLSGYIVNLPFKYLYAYPKICISLNFDQRRFSLQQVVDSAQSRTGQSVPCKELLNAPL